MDPILVFNTNIMSGTKSATTNSTAISISTVRTIGVQVTHVGTITGSVKIQVSNDGQSYSDLTSQSVSLAGASIVLNLPIGVCPFVSLRAVLTVASGTGDIEIQVSGKI